MSSNNNSTNQDNDAAIEVEALLSEKLQELRDPSTVSTKTLNAILDLVWSETKGLLAAGDLFISKKGLETVLEAANRSTAGTEFVFQAFQILLSLFCSANKQAERATYFVDNDGVEKTLKLMEKHQSESVIMFNLLLLLDIVCQNTTDDQRASIAPLLFGNILPIMETHKDDGILFMSTADVLAQCLESGIKVDIELSSRAIACALDGIVLHKTLEILREGPARQLLVALVGEEEATELFKRNNIVYEETLVSKETAWDLLGCVLELRSPVRDDNDVHYLVKKAYNLVTNEANQNENFKSLVYSIKGMETFIKMTSETANHEASCCILYRLGGIMVFLLDNDSSGDRTTHFLDIGGLARCLEIIETEIANGCLVTTYLGVIYILLKGMSGTKQLCVNGGSILKTVFQVLERHDNDADLFSHACATITNSVCCYLRTHPELLQRIVHAAVKGIFKHKDHKDAQSTGRELLDSLFGPESAQKLLDSAVGSGFV